MEEITTVKYDVPYCALFSKTLEKCKKYAVEKNVIVEFYFHPNKFFIGPNTNIEHISRDRGNSWAFGWDTIGPDCIEEYTEEMLGTIKTKMDEVENNSKVTVKKWVEEERYEKENFLLQIDAEVFKPLLSKEWEDMKSLYIDDYIAGVMIKYTEQWGRMLQIKIREGEPLAGILKDHGFQPNYLKVSGGQHYTAKSLLTKYWIHGKEVS